MTTEIDIIRKVPCDVISDELIRDVVRRTIAQSGAHIADSVRMGIGVVFVDDAESAQLNNRYRHKNAPTDVLSFPDAFPDATAHRAEQLRKIPITDDVYLGELMLNCAYIAKYATMDNVELLREFVFVISHGVLHLLGYDHGDDMFAIQDKITDSIIG